MDNLKTLMDKRLYDLVLKVTENSQDCESLFYRISALLAKGQGEEALKCIEVNQKILESDMQMLMRVHIEILCLLHKFDAAYDALEYYKNRPYVSQECEELLRSIPKMIRQEENKDSSMRHLSDEELLKRLKSEDSDTVLMAIDIVRERDVNSFLKPLEEIMTKYPKQAIRSLALLLLVQKKTNQMIKFNHCGHLIEVNPSLLEPPFVGDSFNQIIKQIDNSYHNPVMSQNAVQILSSHLIYIYPEQLICSTEVMIEALYQVTASYLQMDDKEDLVTRCHDKKVDVSEVKALIDSINHSLDDF